MGLAFSQQKPYWVEVTLKDGSQILGLYGAHSFAGNDPNHRDLYLEAAYRRLDTGEWAPLEDTAGVLIRSGQIAVLELRKVTLEVPHE